jgi:hypothetical protein
MDFVIEFIKELRKRASDPIFDGSAEAKVVSKIADELEANRVAYLSEKPPMAEAVKESGYSEVQLRRLRKEGKWSGLRADLPRRPRPASVRSGPQLMSGEHSSLADRIIRRRRTGARS